MNIINNYKYYGEFIPLFIVSAFFIAEKDIEKHTINLSCQMTLTIIFTVVFYILLLNYKENRYIIFSICCILWGILIYIKKKYLEIY